MDIGCLYLNNDGSRWVSTDPVHQHVYVRTEAGQLERRKVRYWFSFGNFAGCAFKFRGKVHKELPKGKHTDGVLIVEVP